MNQSSNQQAYLPLLSILHRPADASAKIRGDGDYPCISGTVKLYQTRLGVIVYSEVRGLPDSCHNHIFGFHIHEGNSCTGTMDDPFSGAMTHYNPNNCTHPYHAGDLPPLFGNGGLAISLFLTDRFGVNEVIGRTVIIHDHPDDFTTQPAGNSGTKIACGVIKARDCS